MLIFQWYPVVLVARCKHKVENLASIVDDKMWFEPIEPAHRVLSLCRSAFIVLCMCIRLMWHDTSGMESMMEMPVHLTMKKLRTVLMRNNLDTKINLCEVNVLYIEWRSKD